jgi:cation-transporting P-type ATPase E
MRPWAEARTTAAVVLFWLGMVVLVLVARPLTLSRQAIVVAMAGLFVASLAVPSAREFFALELPTLIVSFAAVGVGAIAATVIQFFVPPVPDGRE